MCRTGRERDVSYQKWILISVERLVNLIEHFLNLHAACRELSRKFCQLQTYFGEMTWPPIHV